MYIIHDLGNRNVNEELFTDQNFLNCNYDYIETISHQPLLSLNQFKSFNEVLNHLECLYPEMKNSDRTKTIISHGDYKIDFYESNEDDRVIRTFVAHKLRQEVNQ